jgi:hypothetical protein
MRSKCTVALFAITLSAAPLVAQVPRTRDSAGVQIVENPARAKAPTAFQLSEKPVYDVGGRKANHDDELNTISSASLQEIRLSDGRYVVSDLTRFRIFDSTGKQLSVVGRNGTGPGELGSVATICRTRGDTIVITDGSKRDVAVFDGSGQLVREIPLGVATYVAPSGCFDDGTMLITQSVFEAPARTVVTRRRLDGMTMDTIGVFIRPEFSDFITIPQTYAAVGNEVYVGDARASEVRVYNLHGVLTRIIRSADTTNKLSASEQLAMRPRLAAGSTDSVMQQRLTEQFNRVLHTEPRPTEWPVYSRIMVDPNGGVWIQDYPKKPTGLPDVWTGFDASGKLLGKVTLPAWNKNGDPIIRSFTSDGIVILRNGDDGMRHLYTYKLVPVTTGTP